MSIDDHVNDSLYDKHVYTKTGYVMWDWQGYKMTLISTQADENAQHLYRKLGYTDCGGLIFQNTPIDQPMEIFFRKVL